MQGYQDIKRELDLGAIEVEWGYGCGIEKYFGEDRGMNAAIQTSELGEFPATWSVDRVDSAFEIQQGKQVSKKNRAGDNQRLFLRTKNVFWNRLELKELDQMNFTEAEEARLEMKPGDLLLCEGGDIGRTAMWRGEIKHCYHQNHLHRLRAINGQIDPQYGVYWFWYSFNVAKLYIGRGNVTTIPNLSRSKLAELPMVLPLLSEQKKSPTSYRPYNARSKHRNASSRPPPN